MAELTDKYEHRRLSCGIDFAALPLAHRPVAVMEIRVLAGFAFDQPESLGVAHVLNEAITKGTAKRDGRALNDAFDQIGATHGSFAGRETFACSSLCMPEFIERAIELHAEMIRTPTFPDDACKVAVDLTKQALAALDDDPSELAKKLLHRQAYGQPLGRHALGELETLATLGRGQLVDHWRRNFSNRRILVSVAGALEPAAVADLLEREFDRFGSDPGAVSKMDSDQPDEPGSMEDLCFSLDFSPLYSHHPKDLEQEQIAICFPGASVRDEDFAVERVVLGVLAGGMSGRLITEVREKQGLVYWVAAWGDHPRKGGMMHVGASSTPKNVDKTYTTLLREIDRIAEDVSEQEIARAIAGIVTRTLTRGDVTQAKAAELVNDLFYYGRPVPTEEKLDKVKAVTVADIREYLDKHPRDRLSVVTLGTQKLSIER